MSIDSVIHHARRAAGESSSIKASAVIREVDMQRSWRALSAEKLRRAHDEERCQVKDKWMRSPRDAPRVCNADQVFAANGWSAGKKKNIFGPAARTVRNP
jgi:hypothetical protein